MAAACGVPAAPSSRHTVGDAATPTVVCLHCEEVTWYLGGSSAPRLAPLIYYRLVKTHGGADVHRRLHRYGEEKMTAHHCGFVVVVFTSTTISS